MDDEMTTRILQRRLIFLSYLSNSMY